MRLEMPTVTTAHLCVRPLELEDASDLLEVYQDPEVMLGNAGIKPITSMDGMLRFLQYGFLSYRQWGIPQAMVLERLSDGKVVGIIEYHTIREANGELGYLLAQNAWRQGLMSEAMEVMVYLGFTYLHLHRIEAQYDPKNIASEKLLQKNGFVKEGCLRQVMMLNDDTYHDLILCSKLYEEYDETLYKAIDIEYPKEDVV